MTLGKPGRLEAAPCVSRERLTSEGAPPPRNLHMPVKSHTVVAPGFVKALSCVSASFWF